MPHIPSTRRGLIAGAAFLAAEAVPAAAQVPAGPAVSNTIRANAGTVGIISGGVDGTYIRIAADLAAVLDDGDTLRVLPVVGKGSLQNFSDIIYLRGIDAGIVQSDVLAYVLREGLFPGTSRAIQYVAKLYDEEVHILAREGITRVEDLAGQKVNVDVRGSGTAMTATVIFKSLGIAIQPTNDLQEVALRKLRSGEIAALLYVTGKPARMFAALEANAGLHFLPLPLNGPLLDTYLPAALTHAEYPALVPDGAPVETAAVGAVMAVFGWMPGSERHRKVARFVAALQDKFTSLQQPPRHPKWREVNLAAEVPGWTRFNMQEPAAPRPRYWR